MNTLKVSQSGLILIDRARRRKRWNKSDEAWLQAAFTSRSTLNRFWARQAIRQDAFISICSGVGINWKDVIERSADEDDEAFLSGEVAADMVAGSLPISLKQVDWNGAPGIPLFCGRIEELAILEQWIVHDRCRLVLLLGMGGIGKTALSIKLAQQITAQSSQANFEFVIWRSLRNAPRVDDLLIELIQILSQQQEVDLPTLLNDTISRLMHYLQTARCLLILDNAESILQGGDRQGVYQAGYEGYGQLLQTIGNTAHNSCLILTSREKPKGIAAIEGDALPIRCLQLSGLPETAGQAIFQAKGQFRGTDPDWLAISQRYGGNPLALKIAASAIKDLFGGNLSNFLAFLTENPFVFEDIHDLLKQQFERLSPVEHALMYWLAIHREPITLPEIEMRCLFPISTSERLNALVSLQTRSLIERNQDHFTQQPVVMEFVTEVFIEQICEEIITGNLALFKSHALIEAQAKDYIRETQVRFILQAVIDRLIVHLRSLPKLEAYIQRILLQLQSTRAAEVTQHIIQDLGYACGNVINLLRQLRVDLTGYDFSRLPILQANLQGLNLHHVNFSGADLSRSAFTETLGNILAAEFSPDGKQLATCDTDCQIRLWQVQTGQLLLIFQGHHNWVRSVAFSPDGQYLASAGADQTVRVWDVHTGKCLKICACHHGEVHTVVFSPTGQYLASSSSDSTLKLWDYHNEKCVQTFTGHEAWVRSVVFSPDGQQLASGSDDHTIKLWDCHTGNCLQTFTGHASWVRSIAFGREGHTLISSSGDRTLKMWDIVTGDCIRTYTGHQDSIYSIALSQDGQTLASGSGDHTAKLWDIATGRCFRTLSGHTNQVNWVALNPAGNTLACVSLDQTVKLWDCHTGHCFKLWHSHTDWAFPVAFAPDSYNSALNTPTTLLASGSNDHTVKLWDIETGQCLKTLQGHLDLIYSIAFSPDGRFLASGGPDQTVRIWAVSTGKCCQILQGHTDWIFAVAFSPTGETLATCSSDQTIKLWDWQTGRCLKTLQGHTDKIFNVTFSPDGQTLASGCTDQTIRLWQVTTGECFKVLQGHNNRVYSVAFSLDGKTLASGSTDHTVRVWDMSTGQCAKVLTGHRNWVFSVAFSPGGKTLASGSHDHTVRLWDVATGTCSHICEGHEHLVSFVAFSPDGNQVASGSQDQTARLWDVATGQCLKILRANRLYEGMTINRAQGLTDAQRITLVALGAIDDAVPLQGPRSLIYPDSTIHLGSVTDMPASQ